MPQDQELKDSMEISCCPKCMAEQGKLIPLVLRAKNWKTEYHNGYCPECGLDYHKWKADQEKNDDSQDEKGLHCDE